MHGYCIGDMFRQVPSREASMNDGQHRHNRFHTHLQSRVSISQSSEIISITRMISCASKQLAAPAPGTLRRCPCWEKWRVKGVCHSQLRVSQFCKVRRPRPPRPSKGTSPRALLDHPMYLYLGLYGLHAGVKYICLPGPIRVGVI